MSYESDRALVFRRMTFDRDLRSFANFLEALHILHFNHPNNPITVDDLSAEERTVAHNIFFDLENRCISLAWAPFLPCENVKRFSNKKLRAMISGCRILRLQLLPVLISDMGSKIDFSPANTNDRRLFEYLRMCERRLKIYLNPSREDELERSDFLVKVCREYELAD